MKRIDFLKLMGAGAASLPVLQAEGSLLTQDPRPVNKPISIATWRFGEKTTAKAIAMMEQGASALDATEAAVKLCEADPNERSVGMGGRPDRDGVVTLDACCMDHMGNIGSVAAVEDIVHVSSLARAVMEQTPHVMLVGEGARAFAIEMGFPLENLLVEASIKDWESWKAENQYQPIVNVENHDTIGQLSMDANGHLAGMCTTSGMAYKMRGRVGDSPIIGAGLYVDGDVGAATATGHGEEVIRVVGSYRVVSEMERGHSPQVACEKAVKKIHQLFVKRGADLKHTQIGFIAMDVQGQVGGYSLQKGFQYAVHSSNGSTLIDAPYLLS